MFVNKIGIIQQQLKLHKCAPPLRKIIEPCYSHYEVHSQQVQVKIIVQTRSRECVDYNKAEFVNIGGITGIKVGTIYKIEKAFHQSFIALCLPMT